MTDPQPPWDGMDGRWPQTPDTAPAIASWGSPPLLSVDVPGAPATQGSMALLNRATGNMGYPAKTVAARNRMVGELIEAWEGRPRIDFPTRVRLRMSIERPAGHYWPVNRNHGPGELRPDAPPYPSGAKSGDVDKQARLALDALTVAGVWVDDCMAVDLRAVKVWAVGAPSTHIELYRMPPP